MLIEETAASSVDSELPILTGAAEAVLEASDYASSGGSIAKTARADGWVSRAGVLWHAEHREQPDARVLEASEPPLHAH